MKTLLKIVLGLLVLVVLLLAGAYFFAGNLVKTSVEKVVPNITKTTVGVDSVVIVPHSGVFGLKNFKLGNPAGFQQPTSFELGEVEFEVDTNSVIKSVQGSNDAIVINKISVIAPKVTYEIKSGTLTDSNIAAIQKNAEAALGAGGKKPDEKKPDEPKTEEGPEKKFILKEFTFAESTVTIAYGANPVTIPLPSFTLKDLGVAEGGLTGKQLGLKITSEVTKQIISGAASATTKAIKDAGKAAGEAIKDAGQNLKDAGKNAGDSIKNLFN